MRRAVDIVVIALACMLAFAAGTYFEARAHRRLASDLATCRALARAYEAEAWECVRVVDNFVNGPK